MKKMMIAMFAIMLMGVSACTDNQRAKNFGGTAKVELPAGQKLVNATWKNDHLWYLTKPMQQNDIAETLSFKESSNFGLVEGTVIFVEKR